MNYPNEITAIEELVGTNLADASDITPAELRACFAAVTNFLKKISPLASGTYNIGDVSPKDMIRTIALPHNVGTSDYRVQGSLVSKGANFVNDNDVYEMVKDKTETEFKLCLKEEYSATQNLDFEWAIYPKNT